MWTTKTLTELTREELQEEWALCSVHADQCVMLASTLVITVNACKGLSTYYAGMKGHEVFLMALEVVEQSAGHRAHAVADRLETCRRYMENIELLLGYSPEHDEKWESFEVLLDDDGQEYPSLKEAQEALIAAVTRKDHLI